MGTIPTKFGFKGTRELPHATAIRNVIETAAERAEIDPGDVFAEGAHRAKLYDVYALAVTCGVASGLFGFVAGLGENLVGIQS